jgi:hypothetical protein
VRFKNKQRLILSVNVIRKSVLVEIDGYEVVPVGATLATNSLAATRAPEAS